MVQKKQGDTILGRSHANSRIQATIARVNWKVQGPKLLLLACGLVLGGMLVAGLWPFHSPRNQVAWLSGGNGLQFGHHGMILSSGRFRAANAPTDAPSSLEIWFEPASIAASGTLFSFYAPECTRQFSLRQSDAYLRLRSDIANGRFRTVDTEFYVADVFLPGKSSFVTVTSKGGATSVYINGVPTRTAADFPLSSRDFDGELVIGNLPIQGGSWSGLLQGLAFYDKALSPAEVLQHFEAWSKKGRPDICENERAVALYLFDERAGRVIHNRVPSGPDLNIPDRYLVLDQAFLRPFWMEYYPTWSYWNDILINVVGFVPFGFLVCAYFSLAGRIKRPALVTIVLGFALSLTIECLQSLLPTRDSGTTDLITNTLGTCIGVGLYRWNFWRVLLARTWTQFAGS